MTLHLLKVLLIDLDLVNHVLVPLQNPLGIIKEVEVALEAFHAIADKQFDLEVAEGFLLLLILIRDESQAPQLSSDYVASLQEKRQLFSLLLSEEVDLIDKFLRYLAHRLPIRLTFAATNFVAHDLVEVILHHAIRATCHLIQIELFEDVHFVLEEGSFLAGLEQVVESLMVLVPRRRQFLA